MKKHRIVCVFSVLFVVLLCMSLLTACRAFQRIEENQVEKIVVWVYDYGKKEYEMTSDDTKKFIELYNSSKYGGEGTGEGCTPEFGIHVYFRDGTYLLVNDFCGFRKFEVSFRNADGVQKAWYYISSEEFSAFAADLADKAEMNITER